MDDLRIKSLARYMPKVTKDQNRGALKQREATVKDSLFGKMKVLLSTAPDKVELKFDHRDKWNNHDLRDWNNLDTEPSRIPKFRTLSERTLMNFAPKVTTDTTPNIQWALASKAAFGIRKLAKDFQDQDPTFDTTPALDAANDYFHQTNHRLPLPFATNEYLREHHFNSAIPQEREEGLHEAAAATDNAEASLLITIHERLKAKADKDEHTFQSKTFEEQAARVSLESAVKKFDTLFEDAKLEFKHQREINEEPWHDVSSSSGSDDEEETDAPLDEQEPNIHHEVAEAFVDKLIRRQVAKEIAKQDMKELQLLDEKRKAISDSPSFSHDTPGYVLDSFSAQIENDAFVALIQKEVAQLGDGSLGLNALTAVEHRIPSVHGTFYNNLLRKEGAPETIPADYEEPLGKAALSYYKAEKNLLQAVQKKLHAKIQYNEEVFLKESAHEDVFVAVLAKAKDNFNMLFEKAKTAFQTGEPYAEDAHEVIASRPRSLSSPTNSDGYFTAEDETDDNGSVTSHHSFATADDEDPTALEDDWKSVASTHDAEE